MNLVEEVERVWIENWYLDIKLFREDVEPSEIGQYIFPYVGVVESVFKEKFGTP